MMYLGDQAVGIATSLPVFSELINIETGIYTPTEDTLSSDTYVNHSLGKVPDFFMFIAKGIEESAHDKQYVFFGLLQNTLINTENLKFVLDTRAVKTNGTLAGTSGVPDKTFSDNFLFIDKVKFFGPGSYSYLKANIPYYYIIGKFKEVTSNAS